MGPFGDGGELIPINANNLGFDIISNLLFAVAMPTSGEENFGVIQIDSTGTVFPVGSPAGLPTNMRFLAGDVSTDGSTMYINRYPAQSLLYKIDFNTYTATPIALIGGPVWVADWAYNPDDGMLYGAAGENIGPNAEIFKLDPNTGDISSVGQPAGLPLATGNGRYYGGAWFDAAGHLFVYQNSDHIYEIDLAGPTVVDDFEGAAGSSQFNDAGACALAIDRDRINKFYTHTNNDWSLRCEVYETDPTTQLPTEICAEYRLPNTNLDDDIFAEPLDEDNDGFVLYGDVKRKKTVVTPGQYIAVSNIEVSTTHDVWVVEDFENCTDIGSVNPNKVPGGVQVVLIDENGDVWDIDDDLAAGIGGSIDLYATYALVHVEDVPAGSTLRVMVKFKPSDQVNIGDSCVNHEILLDGDGEEITRASAVLTIVEKE